MRWLTLAGGVFLAFAMTACQGPRGPMGEPGEAGTPGQNGQPGEAGAPGRSPVLAGPGLQLQLETAAIDGNGTATVTFTVQNSDGVPLDINGEFTPGAISVRFIMAHLTVAADGGPGPYVAYTVHDVTAPGDAGVTDTQATTDSGGTFEELDPGHYQYTFGTTINVAAADMDKTHTVGAYAERDLDGVTYVANDELNFVPDGSSVTLTRELVLRDNCNKCHADLSAHGGARRDVKLCILCHQPQSTDPDTGNTVDFPQMIHKIHMGDTLPSVVGGTPYEIIGYRQSVHDFSKVAFPQPVNNCNACHGGAPQQDLVFNRPSEHLCTSCHDRTWFGDASAIPAGYTMHSGGPQPDSKCSVCHSPGGSISGFLTGIDNAHLVGTLDPNAPKLELTIDSITNTAPGQVPVLDFTVKVDGTPRDILTNPVPRIRATIAGPTTDYTNVWQGVIQDSFGQNGTLTAIDASMGQFEYTFPASGAIPANATGTYTVGMEGYIESAAHPPPPAAATIPSQELPADPPRLDFSVDGTTPVPRRTVVSADNCNSCHFKLTAHGGFRTDPNYCVMCHNPNNTDISRAARFEDQPALIHSIDFKSLIHKVHAGDQLTQQFSIWAYPGATVANPGGNPVSFNEVEFPQDLGDCATCHVDTSYELPLGPNVLGDIMEEQDCTEPPNNDADNYCETQYLQITNQMTILPTKAVCTSCHDSPSTAAHADVMTTAMGQESCATCHGPGADWAVSTVHTIAP